MATKVFQGIKDCKLI